MVETWCIYLLEPADAVVGSLAKLDDVIAVQLHPLIGRELPLVNGGAKLGLAVGQVDCTELKDAQGRILCSELPEHNCLVYVVAGMVSSAVHEPPMHESAVGGFTCSNTSLIPRLFPSSGNETTPAQK